MATIRTPGEASVRPSAIQLALAKAPRNSHSARAQAPPQADAPSGEQRRQLLLVLGQPGLQAPHPRVQGGRLLQRAQLAHVFRGVEEEPAGAEVRDAAGMQPGWQASGGRTCHGGGLQPDSEVCWEAACRGASQAIWQLHPATSAGLGPHMLARSLATASGTPKPVTAWVQSSAEGVTAFTCASQGKERGAHGEAGI